MKVYEARVIFEDKSVDCFQFTKYSYNNRMFKFEEQIKEIVRILFIKDIKYIKFYYVGEVRGQSNEN